MTKFVFEHLNKILNEIKSLEQGEVKDDYFFRKYLEKLCMTEDQYIEKIVDRPPLLEYDPNVHKDMKAGSLDLSAFFEKPSLPVGYKRGVSSRRSLLEDSEFSSRDEIFMFGCAIRFPEVKHEYQGFSSQKIETLLHEIVKIIESYRQRKNAEARGEQSYQRVKQYLDKHWKQGQAMSSCDERMLNDTEIALGERQITTHRQRYFEELKAAK